MTSIMIRDGLMELTREGPEGETPETDVVGTAINPGGGPLLPGETPQETGEGGAGSDTDKRSQRAATSGDGTEGPEEVPDQAPAVGVRNAMRRAGQQIDELLETILGPLIPGAAEPDSAREVDQQDQAS